MGVPWGFHGGAMGVLWGCHEGAMGVLWGCLGVPCAWAFNKLDLHQRAAIFTAAY
jgi:hypothetical protein